MDNSNILSSKLTRESAIQDNTFAGAYSEAKIPPPQIKNRTKFGKLCHFWDNCPSFGPSPILNRPKDWKLVTFLPSHKFFLYIVKSIPL